jgi:hypothetical protein
VTQIIKEKYYPNENFLYSALGHKPFYAWRSIWQGKDLLKARLVWLVGNMCTVKIWEDRWLSNPSSFVVQSFVRRLNREARVKDFRDEDSGWRNVPLVMEIFNKEEAEKICSMPISTIGQADKLIWCGTANGIFREKCLS